MTLPSEQIDPREPADGDLVAALAAGSMSALGTLVGRHQGRIRALAYRLTHRWDVADDIAQEAFLRLYRAAPRYRPDASLKTWLYRVTVNLVLDRAKKRRPQGDFDATEAVFQAESPEATLIRHEAVDAVRRAVAQLPERQRVVLVLHRYDDLSHQEIANVTGWSTSAVESLLVRAYGRLREELGDWAK